VTLKMVPPRNARTKCWYLRGSYLGVAIDRSTGTDKRYLAEVMLARLQGEIEAGAYREAPVDRAAFLNGVLAPQASAERIIELAKSPAQECPEFTNQGFPQGQETPAKPGKKKLRRVPFTVSRLMEFCTRRDHHRSSRDRASDSILGRSHQTRAKDRTHDDVVGRNNRDQNHGQSADSLIRGL
jgi:hypothetical protein